MLWSNRRLLQGIIHRDLKGNNIFCGEGGLLKLGDFGISKVLTPNARAARTMIGTPYYMSPEILKVRTPLDRRDMRAGTSAGRLKHLQEAPQDFEPSLLI